jgi:hypothetical protein
VEAEAVEELLAALCPVEVVVGVVLLAALSHQVVVGGAVGAEEVVEVAAVEGARLSWPSSRPPPFQPSLSQLLVASSLFPFLVFSLAQPFSFLHPSD